MFFRSRSAPLVLLCLVSLGVSICAQAKTYYVAKTGNDANNGSKEKPFFTISRAAELAQPGDTVTVSAGIYRERVSPPRGGTSDAARIVYQAATGEKAEIRGSEVIKTWRRVSGDLWQVTLPNAFFGDFNPYGELVGGDWFGGSGYDPRGEVFLNGVALKAAVHLEELHNKHAKPLWYGTANTERTVIWAEFPGVDPNKAQVEITVRPAVFYPKKTNIDYITVRGFTLKHAAPQWAPPTAEQMGLIGTHWSKGWIIENNVISDSRNVCVTLGKYGDEWDNNRTGTADGYNGTIRRAFDEKGWSAETIGHHVVRNNVISECGQAGVVGSLGAIFSTITDNVIHDINIRQNYSGAEVAGIKIHGAVDTLIARNHIYRAAMGVWLDWMAQGTRVQGNLMHHNLDQDIMIEVNHGPVLVDNNILLSKFAILDDSQGVAYVHNLMAGAFTRFGNGGDSRTTPYFKPHTITFVGLRDVPGGDQRFYNNFLASPEVLAFYKNRKVPDMPNVFGGNAFFNNSGAPVRLSLIEKPDGWYLDLPAVQIAAEDPARVVNTELLGKAQVPQQLFENPDGSPVSVDTDYFGKVREAGKPGVGPFVQFTGQKMSIKVWPKK